MIPWRTFLLTIKRNQTKADTTLGLLRSQGMQAEVFYGVDSQITGLWTDHLYEIDAPGSGYRQGPRTVNLHLSHFLMWKVFSYLAEDAFLVLEDDVRLIPTWNDELETALTHLPADWDLFYLGSCCCKGNAGNELIWGRLCRVRRALCTHAYAVRKKALPLLIEKGEKVWAPCDILLALDCMPHLNCYAMLPRIAEQLDTVIAE